MKTMISKWFLVWIFVITRSFIESGAASSPGYRLPDNVIPRHYIVDILTNLEKNDFSFQGQVWIKVAVEKATDTVIMHSRNLTISAKDITVKQIASEESLDVIPVVSVRLVPENEFLVIKVDRELPAGKEYIINIQFKGTLTESLAGYYRSSYFDRTANATKWLAVTQFESTDARRAFPCFDEPAMKAQFSINLGHKKHLKSASNMPLINTTNIDGMDGWVWDKYADTVPMSTYLVAYMVSEFEYKEAEKTKNNVTFRIWARKDALSQVEFAKEVGPKFLEYYETFFDVKYPLPKQDMVAIPDFSAGAMENWGLITYRETALLFDEKTSSAASKQSIASIIAHELAHQWFGNLVTMKWWTDLWLNEGFATYVAGIGVHHVFPEWNSLNWVAVDNMLVVFGLDSLKSSHPVSVTIGNPNEIAQIFDTISYKKGSFLLRMMNLFLGEDVFRSGVTNYLMAHRYNNAEQNDLWDSLTNAAHKAGTLDKGLTVKEIMDTWTLQTGYPVITVSRDYEKGSATIEQTRYLAVKLGPRETEKSCWWVPVSYTTQKILDFNETRPKLWLSCKENGEIFDVGPKEEWLILNVNIAGLYRVNYDDKNWRNLAAVLNSENYKSIGTLNRVQLLADGLEFAWSGDLDYKLAFQLVKYLKNEKEYLPWKSGLSNLNNIEKLLRRTAAYGLFKRYMRTLLAPVYQRFNKLTDTPKNFEEVKFKSLITGWSCHMEVESCIDQAFNLFKQWKSESNPDSTNPIPADMRGTVYCLGIRLGNERDWDYLWERYNKSNVGTEQSLILSALGCSRDVWVLNRYLDMSINENSNIRRQDSVTVFSSVARNEVGYYLAKNFLYTNIKKIYNYFGPKTSKIGRYVSSISDHMVSDEELEELKRFLSTNRDYVKYSALAAKQSMESTVVNIRWFSNYYDKVLRIVAP